MRSSVQARSHPFLLEMLLEEFWMFGCCDDGKEAIVTAMSQSIKAPGIIDRKNVHELANRY